MHGQWLEQKPEKKPQRKKIVEKTYTP